MPKSKNSKSSENSVKGDPERTDIDALKEELSRLKKEHEILKEKFEIYNELSEEGLFIHENFVIKEANRAFEKMTGYAHEELLGMHGSKLLTPDSLKLLKQTVSNPTSEPIEVSMIAKDGTIFSAQTKGKSFSVGNVIRRAGIFQDITEIKKARKELEESEEKHRLVSSLLSDYVYTCTIKLGQPPVLVWMSSPMEKICGYTKAEIEGLADGWFSIIHPDDVQSVAESVNKDYSENKSYENEYRIIDKKGNIRWMLDRSMMTKFDESTGEFSFLGATKDITDRKKIEEDLTQRSLDYKNLNENLYVTNKKLTDVNNKLVESERKYKNLVESFAQGIGISHGEKILFANKALINIYGLDSLEEFCSRKLTDYMTPKSRKEVKARLKKIEQGIPQGSAFRYEIIRKDSAIRTLEIVSNELIHDGKKCRQVIINDITARLEFEDELARAAHIFENIQIGLLIYYLENIDDDQSLRLIAVNPAALELVGLSEHEILGKLIDEIFPNLRRNRIPQQFTDVARTQKPIDIDDFSYGDDRIVEAAYSIKAFPLPNNCVGVSFENVSERIKAEKELRTRNNELNNFVYKVSHDLRAPLSSIKGLLHLSKLENNHVDHLPRIEERINHLDGFIRDILSHSRNLNTSVIIDKLDIQEIISDCFVELEYLSEAKLIEKSTDISGGAFYNDNVRFYEITRNLISNAFKYRDINKDRSYLKVIARITSKFATFIFEDNGIGIEKSYQQKIFNMFYRATDIGEGSGIGLYIVSQAIEKLGGKVSVTSKIGVGTTFTVVLPNMIGNKQKG